MFKIRSFVIILLLLSGRPAAQPSLAGQLKEFHQRGGLPNFFAKVKARKKVTVAYLGGSITEANNGWRDLTFNWLATTYPGAGFTQVNATAGGTGSDLGVFRMNHDVLPHKPDLLFVEFAVNDFGSTTESIYRTMEGIVRKTWRRYPQADICFVYTIAENNIKDLQAGKYQFTALAMEQIAEHYRIPSIHMGVEVIKLLDAGKLIFTGVPEEHPHQIVFTTDHTHPLSGSGHPIYAGVVEHYLQEMAQSDSIAPHDLGAPFVADNWEDAQMIPLSRIKNRRGFKKLAGKDTVQQQFKKFMPAIYKAMAPGATFTVRFTGKVLGVYDLIGPPGGIVTVTVDGGAPQDIFRFDQWGNYYRKSAFFLKDLDNGPHQATFTVTGKSFDKAALLRKRKITMTDPAMYRENSWLLSSILVLGKLKEQ